VKVLIVDDDPVARRLLGAALARTGFEVVEAADGSEALRTLNGDRPPPLTVLDWMMPDMDGVEVCRRLRERPPGGGRPYVILVTAKDSADDIVTGLEAGADDYVIKPFDPEELRARVRVGMRIVGLQHALTDRVRELEEALARVTQLQGLLPICGWCKRIREDRDYWQQIEVYISKHSGARFTHGICPECAERVRREFREPGASPSDSR
jgi:DNA-binding response OmpR family regulator